MILWETFYFVFEDELRRTRPKTTNVEIMNNAGYLGRPFVANINNCKLALLAKESEREYIFQLWVVCAPKLCHVTLPGA